MSEERKKWISLTELLKIKKDNSLKISGPDEPLVLTTIKHKSGSTKG